MAKILEVENLTTYFHTFKGVVKAVDHISFSMEEGEILGVVGESGGGKSVTGFSIIGLVDEPGEVKADKIFFSGMDLTKKTENEMNRIRGDQVTMVFQDPMTSLNPVYTIERQIAEVLKLHQHGITKTQCRQRCIELLKEVGIPNAEERLKCYPHQFSGGMRQRVVIAIALAGNPKLIIADEPTTALDVTIQAQVLMLMKRLVAEKGCALMLITHDLAVVSEVTHRVNVMYCGHIVEAAPTRQLIEHPLHPYTVGLLASIPSNTTIKQDEHLEIIPGMVPNMFDLPKGCKFAPRCSKCMDICMEVEPEMITVEPGRQVACHLYAKDKEGAL
ncbi:MAG: ABC transporter ATP-binding protein [Clostridia bacterium]